MECGGLKAWLLIAVITASLHHHTHHGYPVWWRHQAACIRYQESRNQWHIRNYPYGGAFQVVDSTWSRFKVKTWPASWQASPAQQTFVAWRIWAANGRMWGNHQWPLSSRACGVR